MHTYVELAMPCLMVLACSTSVAGQPVRLLVSGKASDNLVRFDGGSGALVDVFVPTGSGGLNAVEGLVVGPDGNLYVNSAHSDSILRYDGSNGAFVDAFVASKSGGLDKPVGLVFGPDGQVPALCPFQPSTP